MKPIIEKLLKKTVHSEPKLVAKVPDEDFIPYVCHYDPKTILTKNGELLQVIRITGFNNNSVAAQLISLRDSVRDAITDHVKNTEFALWFNTIRRKKNISPKGEFPDFFSKKIDDIWTEENNWHDQYVNELYITIIIEGLDSSIVNMNSFMRSFSYFTTKSLHQNFLQEAHVKLSKLGEDILKSIEEYGAKFLSIKEWEGVIYSEPMRFFGKIVNLYEERYPLSANDISSDLSGHKIAFGNRELEVSGEGHKNFGAILSLKEYFEVSTESLDRILQLPFEFIITQSFDFAFTKKDLEHQEYQNYVLQVSGDESLRQLSGLANFMESKHDLPTDYGKLQTTIMIISETQKQLEDDIKMATERFNSLGLVAVREDLFLEHCFWAQLPGNFRYLARQKIINTYRIGGFAALHNFPDGSIAGNHWGPAVTVFRTVLNTPYFFNFHDRDLGHSLILGPKNSGKTMLLNFLLAQSRRFNNKIFYFDFNNKAKCFIKALGGKYYAVGGEGEEALKLDPNNPDSKNEFNWLDQIIAFDLTELLSQKSALISLADYLLDAIENSLDGSPTIIAINHAWDLLDNQIIAPKIDAFLSKMREKNVVVIFIAEDAENFEKTELAKEIKKNLITKIFMPNHQASKSCKEIFGLNDEEIEILKMMADEERHFLFKRGEDTVISMLDFSKFIEISKILSADQMTLLAMEEVINASASEEVRNPEPQIWLPQLFEVLKAIEHERLEDERRKEHEELLREVEAELAAENQ